MVLTPGTVLTTGWKICSRLLEVAQAGDVFEDFFEFVVADLALEGGNEGAGFFGCVAAEGRYFICQSSLSINYPCQGLSAYPTVPARTV